MPRPLSPDATCPIPIKVGRVFNTSPPTALGASTKALRCSATPSASCHTFCSALYSGEYPSSIFVCMAFIFSPCSARYFPVAPPVTRSLSPTAAFGRSKIPCPTALPVSPKPKIVSPTPCISLPGPYLALYPREACCSGVNSFVACGCASTGCVDCSTGGFGAGCASVVAGGLVVTCGCSSCFLSALLSPYILISSAVKGVPTGDSLAWGSAEVCGCGCSSCFLSALLASYILISASVKGVPTGDSLACGSAVPSSPSSTPSSLRRLWSFSM